MKSCPSLLLGAILGILIALTTASMTAAAGPTRLMPGSVSPTSGTTSTTFVFSVDYSGNETDNETASTVRAVASNGSTTRTVSLVRTGGTALNGTWSGSSTLPAGTWSVTFSATSSLSTNPTRAGPTVIVTAPTPPPTPAPTPRPPPRPTATPRPTSVPGTATPTPASSLSPTPFGTTLTDPSGRPSSSAGPPSEEPTALPSPSPAPENNPPGSGRFNVPLEGVVAIGLLGAVTVAAALGERRRRQAADAFRAAEASADGAPPAQPEDLAEGWERDLSDEETVATIDYDAPDDAPDDADGPSDDSRDSMSR